VPVEPDRTPEVGYHFTEDMTDQAIDWIRQRKALMPDKPFFIYVSDDYGPQTSAFTGRIHWVQLDADTDDLDHLISPDERLRVAIACQ
jgi:arylsulfatase A-like enzyme